MQCIRTFGFTAIALVVGTAAASANMSGIATIATHSMAPAPLMSQKAMMSKSMAAKKVGVDNAVRERASALRASVGSAGLALSQQHLGQSSTIALRAGLTSKLALPIAAHQPPAPTSRMHGMASESSALAFRAKNLVDTAGAANRAYSLQPK